MKSEKIEADDLINSNLKLGKIHSNKSVRFLLKKIKKEIN